jgi:hypothetical protein
MPLPFWHVIILHLSTPLQENAITISNLLQEDAIIINIES